MKKLLLILLIITTQYFAQMEKFPLLEPISNTIPESFIIEGGENELITFWIDSTDLHMSKSFDEGTTWNTPITLVNNTIIIDSLSDLNALKLNSGRILVTYKFKFHYVIYSDDNGTTWSEPTQLVTDFGSIRPRQIMESSLSQTNDNKIWLVYNRLNVISNIQSDDGITWSERDTIIVLNNGYPQFSSVNSHWNNSLILFYQLDVNDTSEIYKLVSIDSGKTWSEGELFLDNGINKGRPRVTKDSNKALWLTFTQVEVTPFEEFYQSNIYYSKLPDGAYSWGTPAKFTEYTGFDGWQNISIANEKPYITFTSKREGTYSLWYGVAEETNDDNAPPAIYATEIYFQNDYPNVILNITAKVFDTDEIDIVMFNYKEKGGAIKGLQLFDDGLHGDEEAGDLIFGNRLTDIKHTFKFEIFYTAIDIAGNKSITATSNIESPFEADGGDTFFFDNNNVKFPINSKGILADVYYPDYKKNGVRFDEAKVIYSAGFALTGYTNGTLWGNGMMTTSRSEDYLAGPIESSDAITQIYVIRLSQPDFYQSWDDWKDAVKLGADYYDGNGDGIYNPVDLNGNGTWDRNEDKPDIIGDITAFTVFNDGLDSSLRTYGNVEPQGIEIKQTIFSYDEVTSPKLANVIFVRYKIENMGTVADRLDSVYFGAFADMDIGNYNDDSGGTDSTVNAFYGYNGGDYIWDDGDPYRTGYDSEYGGNAPSCFISLIQAPPVYINGVTYIDADGNGIYDDGIDTSLDSAISRKGELLGTIEYPGAKNNKLTASTLYISSHPSQGDPHNEYELRSYMLGFNQDGNLIDPCNWEFGEVFNMDCSSVNPPLMYSGDPVTEHGWVNDSGDEMRQLGSTGPFDLVKGEPIEIIVAYIVGRGTDHLNSITEARRITNDVIGFYNSNFTYVPVGVKENITNQPTEFSLSQNYPNPFNPSTTIRYSISKDVRGEKQEVRLMVYDILGREVATLVNQQQKAGSYVVKFDASNLTSGVYFYRLNSGSFTESRKMLLLK